MRGILCDESVWSGSVNVATWLWIPITLWAAFAQSVRNAAQRHLTIQLGTIGATSVRFIYGLPLALAWLMTVLYWTDSPWPRLSLEFWSWVVVGALAQIVGTALLVRAMSERNFALGVAYSKTEAVQATIVALLIFGERLSIATSAAVTLATLGVMFIASTKDAHPIRGLIFGWTARSAQFGLGAGTAFAVSAVGFRGATVALFPAHYLVAAAVTLVVAQSLQSITLILWLRWREAGALGRIANAWRGSLVAGAMGAAATAGWFTAMAIEPIAHVRTLGLAELLFSLAISLRIFREHLRAIDWFGMSLLLCGLVLVTLG